MFSLPKNTTQYYFLQRKFYKKTRSQHTGTSAKILTDSLYMYPDIRIYNEDVA